MYGLALFCTRFFFCGLGATTFFKIQHPCTLLLLSQPNLSGKYSFGPVLLFGFGSPERKNLNQTYNRATFTAEFSQASRAKMPLPPSELTAMAKAASSRARGRLNAVPSAGSGDDALEEALSALGDFVELAISKVCEGVVGRGGARRGRRLLC